MPNIAIEMTTAPAVSEETSPGLTTFEQGVIDVFVRLADLLGVPKSVGEIYGLLFASPRPLAFQDVTGRLGISKGSASQGLRLLRALGAIKPVYVAGDRRDYFVPETELRALLAGFLREKVKLHLDSGLARIESLRAIGKDPEFCGTDAEAAKLLRSRVDKLHNWHKRGRTALPLVSKIFG